MFGVATQNARLAVSVRVHGTERRGVSVDSDRRDRVVSWRCRSSSMYGGTEVDRALRVMTAILYWMRCWTDNQWRDFNTIRYDTIEEINVDSKAEYTA